jgi:hypothetical protein
MLEHVKLGIKLPQVYIGVYIVVSRTIKHVCEYITTHEELKMEEPETEIDLFGDSGDDEGLVIEVARVESRLAHLRATASAKWVATQYDGAVIAESPTQLAE